MKCGFDRSELWNNFELYIICFLKQNMRNKLILQNSVFIVEEYFWFSRIILDECVMDIKDEVGVDLVL